MKFEQYPSAKFIVTPSVGKFTKQYKSTLQRQGGYALIVIVIVLMLVGAVATGGVSLSTKTERLAGNAIQRSRSFQAADGAATLAEIKINEMMQGRVFADITASTGIFARDMRSEQWWRKDSADGVHVTDTTLTLGVVSPPRYIIEQKGHYISDGGTGVVNLDVGSGAYGRETAGGRELLLFSVESQGMGSFDTVETIVETTVVFTY